MPFKIGLIFLWFLLTPVVLVASIFLFLGSQETVETTGSVVAQEAIVNSLEGQVLGTHISDLRPLQVANFLKGTEVAPYAGYMVEIADKYGIDYRLIPAIAMKEGAGGNTSPEGSYNTWGFENGRTRFTSWKHAIDIVGKTLKTRYIDKGLVTPDQIMPVYAPPAPGNGGKWAQDVNLFIEQMSKL